MNSAPAVGGVVHSPFGASEENPTAKKLSTSGPTLRTNELTLSENYHLSTCGRWLLSKCASKYYKCVFLTSSSYLILLSRQGKVVSLLTYANQSDRNPLDSYFLSGNCLLTLNQRLAKWFTTLSPKEKSKIVKDVSQLVLARRTRMCNFLEYKGDDTRLFIECSFANNTRFEDSLSTLRLPLFHRWLRLNRQ